MSNKQKFILTDQHLKLLSRMVVGWQDCEFGAPEIDPKRPYGNSSVIADIVEILGIPQQVCPHCDEPISEDGYDEDELQKLHEETETALQIVLSTQSFIPGKYTADEYGFDWKLEEK